MSVRHERTSDRVITLYSREGLKSGVRRPMELIVWPRGFHSGISRLGAAVLRMTLLHVLAQVQPESSAPPESGAQSWELPGWLPALLITCGLVLGVVLLVNHYRRWVAGGRPERPAPVAAASPDMLSMQELEELTQRLAVSLDEKTARLEGLLAQANRSIERLEQALEIAGQGTLLSTSMPFMDQPPIDPIHQRVYELADQGMSSVEIARTLEQQPGQVELILALRRREATR